MVAFGVVFLLEGERDCGDTWRRWVLRRISSVFCTAAPALRQRSRGRIAS
jgi:hypothetical protein